MTIFECYDSSDVDVCVDVAVVDVFVDSWQMRRQFVGGPSPSASLMALAPSSLGMR